MAKKTAGTATRNNRSKPKPPHKLVPGDYVRLKDAEINGQTAVGIVIGNAESTRKQVLQGMVRVGFAQVIALRDGNQIIHRPQVSVVDLKVEEVEWLETVEFGIRNEFTEFDTPKEMVDHYSKP